MSKRKQTRQSRSPAMLYGAAAVVVLLIVAGVFLVTRDSTAGTPVSQSISAAEYQSQFAASDATYLLLDVRTPDEFASGHISGAVNIPVEELANRLNEVPKGEPLVVYCRSGRRSAEAVQILSQAGYTSIYDLGALNDWTAQGFPVE